MKTLKPTYSAVRLTGLRLIVVCCIAVVSQGCLAQPLVVRSSALAGQGVEQPAAQPLEGIKRIEQPPVQPLQEIKNYIEARTYASEADRIDFIRNWVHQNSIHQIDAAHNRYAFNTPVVLSMLWQTHLTAQNPAHLSCGPRAAAMRAILTALAIPSRTVMIFTDNYTEVRSHTFLEVYNRETHNWELQDPDFNLYYTRLGTQERVATADLIWGDLDAIIPHSPTANGWEENGVSHLKQDYFEAMIYMNHLEGKRSVVLINLARFHPKKVFKDNGDITFYAFAKKFYRNPIFVTHQGSKGQ